MVFKRWTSNLDVWLELCEWNIFRTFSNASGQLLFELQDVFFGVSNFFLPVIFQSWCLIVDSKLLMFPKLNKLQDCPRRFNRHQRAIGWPIGAHFCELAVLRVFDLQVCAAQCPLVQRPKDHFVKLFTADRTEDFLFSCICSKTCNHRNRDLITGKQHFNLEAMFLILHTL